MEHRWSRRMPCEQTVLVESPHIGAVAATMRDLSTQGMYIEIGDCALPPHTPLRIFFRLDDDALGTDIGLEAMVVRRDARGVGLMFLDTTPAVTAVLQQAVYASLSGARIPLAGRRPNAPAPRRPRMTLVVNNS